MTMTRAEYEENRRRLEVYAADAKRAYLQEKAAYDGICEELQSLQDDWDEQQRNQTATEQ
ncbi:hypothetical protein AB0387_26410 [Streptomyces sp. NPDC089173]|uniref:hypothetical protein n=1 Tax=Streptomyces sp. NPDC089173 TaxID=3154965 RepID=UPI00344F9C6D